MNDDFADALVIPAMQRVIELMKSENFDGVLVWGDGGTTDVRIQLDDYWAVGADGDLMDSAEKLVGRALAAKRIKRFVFTGPVSYQVLEDGPFGLAHRDRLEPKLIWALCVDINSGYDLCAIHFVQRPDGSYSFQDDITMLSGEQQMLDAAVGFTAMRVLLEAS